MREILFRGKRLDNGEWYYGSYLFLHISSVDWTGAKRGKPEDVHYIVNDQDINYAVDPSTIGQYTGLNDKNGKMIFEGHILSLRTGRPHVVMFKDGAFILKDSAIPISFANKFEIIGNVHDNPELLKEEAKP